MCVTSCKSLFLQINTPNYVRARAKVIHQASAHTSMLVRRAFPLLRSACPTLRRRLPRPSSELTRSFLHLPVIAAGVGKIIATAGLKKIAVNSVVRKLGARRVLADLRGASAALRRRSPHVYSAEAFEGVGAGLDALERSLQGVQENEQVLRVWRWFEALEKTYPSLYAVVFKSYVETWTPVKWAAALMRDASSSASISASAREGEAPSASPPHAQLPDDPEAEGPPDAREQIALLQKLHRAAPELNHYHVLLLPKDRGHRADIVGGTESDVSRHREAASYRPAGKG